MQIINMIIGGILSVFLSMNGWGLDTHQFWVIYFFLCALIFNTVKIGRSMADKNK